jgi:hypothetical protein
MFFCSFHFSSLNVVEAQRRRGFIAPTVCRRRVGHSHHGNMKGRVSTLTFSEVETRPFLIYAL